MSRHINLNFTQEEIDLKLMARAKEVSLKSKDPSTQVGAVLAKSGVEISSGYNGFPHGVDDSPERYADRYIKYPMVVHAEVNAILQAGHAAEGCDLYVYPSFDLPPICADCAGVAIQAGIVCIIGYIPNPGDERAARWADSVSISKTMWEEAGLQIRSYQEV